MLKPISRPSGWSVLDAVLVVLGMAVFLAAAAFSFYEIFLDYRLHGAEAGHAAGSRLFVSNLIVFVSGFAVTGVLFLNLYKQRKSLRDKSKVLGLLEARVAAMEASIDGMMITDRAGIIRYANRAMAKYHGYDSPEDIVGRSWRILYSENESEKIKNTAMIELLQKWHWRGQYRGLRKDGSAYHQDMSMTALADGGYVWVVNDFTELLENIQLAEQRLAAIEAAGDGIGIVDGNGSLSYINRSLQLLHDIGDNELNDYIGLPWEKLYDEKEQANIKDRVLAALDEQGHWEGEVPIYRRDGSVIHTELSLTSLPNGGLIGTTRDVTQRKKAEEEKEALQQQFFQAQKMEAVGRLAGGIAHDFNNILAAMLGYAEFLIEDLAPDSKEYQYASKIMSGGMQARQVVEQILMFSRREGSRKQVMDLVDTVHDVQTMLGARSSANISIHVGTDVDSAYIEGNQTQLGQVLMNLCVNAMDAMPEEKGELNMTLSRYVAGQDGVYKDMLDDQGERGDEAETLPTQRLQEGEAGEAVLCVGRLRSGRSYICISVADNGEGIARDVMEQMFEPFFTTKDVEKGTGLGLSSVHGIIMDHRGAIRVESKTGERSGTVFRVFLPEESAGRQHIAESGREESGIITGEGRILVVEDQEEVRSMLNDMVSRMGYVVTTCPSGLEAIDVLRERNGGFDLVVSDVVMPELSGEELALQVQEDFPGMPFVFVSAHGKEGVARALNAHAEVMAFLPKPVDSLSLSRAINALLTKERRAA
jgi:PAS domain S-box-containing protein